MASSPYTVNWAFIIFYFLFVILLLLSISAVSLSAEHYATVVLVFILLGSATVLNEYENPEDESGFWLYFYIAILIVCGVLLLMLLISALYSLSTSLIALTLALVFTVATTFDLIVIGSGVLIFWGLVALTMIFYFITLTSLIEDKNSSNWWEWVIFSIAIISLLMAFFVKREYQPPILSEREKRQRRITAVRREEREDRDLVYQVQLEQRAKKTSESSPVEMSSPM